MSGLAETALAAFVALRPGVGDADRAWFADVAADVATVVQDEPARLLPFGGAAAARERAVRLLVAVAWHETGLRPDIDRCERFGDGGRSVGLWQIHQSSGWGGYSTRSELCGDRRAQVRAASRALAFGVARCGGTVAGAATAYNAGRCGEPGAYARHVEAALARVEEKRRAKVAPVGATGVASVARRPAR